MLNKHEEAEELKKIIISLPDINDDTMDSLIYRGLALKDLKQNEEALKLFEKVIEKYPSSFMAHAARGNKIFQKKKLILLFFKVICY